jgi:hypothetical protein
LATSPAEVNKEEAEKLFIVDFCNTAPMENLSMGYAAITIDTIKKFSSDTSRL